MVAAVLAGASTSEIAAQYGLSKSAVGKWVHRFRRSGTVAGKPKGGDGSSLLRSEREWMLARLAAEPDLTASQLHQDLCARGVRVGYRSVERFLQRERRA